MTGVTATGLSRVKDICQNRSQRVKELKAEGKPVIGYLCIYPILEMITAFDMVPYRIFGDMDEPITDADDYMPSIVCPFLRSILDLGLKGRYDFLDGVVMAHICDVGARTAHLWDVAVKTPYSHYIDIPHTNRENSRERLKELLVEFQKSLESFTGREMSRDKLRQSIEKHNEQRRLVRELYDLKKSDPPLISGTEILQIMKALMSLPVEEGNTLLREVLAEIQNRENPVPEKPARLLVWGPVIDDTAFIEMIEGLDASVVMDDTCVGSRAFFPDVPLTDDPLDGLAYHYLENIKCPRTLRDSNVDGTTKGYNADLETRFGYIGDFARDWNVNGVILQALRYCDSHGYEVPQIKDYLDSIGLPNIYLEHDYSKAALGPLMTRIQAFTEIIG
ncbi:MAG: 2-hydroxyacyl-CoA dehydratase [Dehalococcoidales bacterium]|nr:MAG: 2-hydroxyacyl-CoA dehydratase [Dehalococcoidales bacterium]